ncbi:Methyl-accepting chemotaxis protein (MCP) signalling domain-containing protein [Desulfatibacillum alkenivorans DSM 16219]|uniref:Methyl-accepting chemotaxis protein (MCP) signalling domain-containing protein n=1 Tax=Desulfatibacillum alkenivorans DSM 16219 TaxID=1121393 RepID=A0A1M6NL78_9BACT|nr:Cache 3/Cache 2 fusion domain-containing protein [Desulfatibacillum alkenivorans]SHJ96334.1 Methyl-accepting chemotaxis protein (MCP) signalling domain-containing protein [Desulfatibacillum alkenivorans DSM 16219]
MARRVNLSTKVMGLASAAVLITCLVMMGLLAWQGKQMQAKMKGQMDGMARQQVANIVQGLYRMAINQDEAIRRSMESNLRIAQKMVQDMGGINMGRAMVDWEIVNQFTQEKTTISLPTMLAGDLWLGQNTKFTAPSPLVDDITDLTHMTCTIFQRIPETGDMLRVSTTVKKLDGQRAIGTYIPNMHNGEPNKVIETVMQGETFFGRAFVVNAWYLTAYQPITSDAGEIVGILYVGAPEDKMLESIKSAIASTSVGKTGYSWVLAGSGKEAGLYVVSKDRQSDGKNILGVKDSDGNYFVKKVIDKGLQAKPGEINFESVPWKNPGEEKARVKIQAFTYYPPWDWVIGAGAYEEDFMEAQQEVDNTIKRLLIILGGASLGIILLALAASFLMAKGISNPVQKIVKGLNEGLGFVACASDQVASSSQSLANGATEQAASVETTSAALVEMSSMTKQNAQHAGQADKLMKEVESVVTEANQAMEGLTRSMEEITSASDETFKIVKTIDEIAFQTNLLALNAAVEAARAGEAGAGFAVVADEVRNLASRAAEAAGNTALLIEGTVKKIEQGSGLVTETNHSFGRVAGRASKVAQLVSEIAEASHEQADGIEQINHAIAEMEKVTQQNTGSAEESASASEELKSQSLQMQQLVAKLLTMITGENFAQAPVGSGAASDSAGGRKKLPEAEGKQIPYSGD